MVKEQKHRIKQSFEAEQKGLFAFVRSKIQSLEEAEDLVQEVFFQALTHLNVLETVDNLTGWLYTVAKNKIIDWYRKKRLPLISLEEPAENGLEFKELLAAEIPEELDEKAQPELIQAILDSIETLPEKQKYVFIQQVIEGRTFNELAAETGESVNTLIARKRYAIQFLKKQLTKIKKIYTES